MGFRTSYSQNSTYTQCPQYWDWSYNKRLKGDTEGASLYFGSAVDEGVMCMLDGKANYIEVFEKSWEEQTNMWGKVTTVFDNPNIIYGYNDFDIHVLESGDEAQLSTWMEDLGVGVSGDNPVEEYKEIVKVKRNPYKKLTDSELKYFNRCSWLSMKRKGKILIESFKDQFYPKIKRVLATQKKCEIVDPATGDKITGVIDMVVELEGYDKPVIIDLKTAAQPYTQSQIETGEQLTLYAGMEAASYNTDLVGYVILCKNINKEDQSYCASCGHFKTTKHRTCDNVVGNVRCGSPWVEKKILKPQVQVLIEQKTPEQIAKLFSDIGNIILAMKNGVIYKNTNKCENWYGSRCVYYDACHKGDLTGLKKK